MDISLIIKVAGVGILVSVATQILSKSGRDEPSMLVTLTGIVVVLLLLVEEIALLFDFYGEMLTEKQKDMVEL